MKEKKAETKKEIKTETKEEIKEEVIVEESNKKMTEKTKSIILTVILAVIALVLISFLAYDKFKQEGYIMSKEQKEIMAEFYKYYNSEERTVIYYAKENCSWCELETPILETIASDYDMDYLYLDISKLGKKQKKEITSLLGIESSTPTTVIVEKGEVIAVNSGYVKGKEYTEFFATNGVIPEDAVYSADSYLTYIDFEEYSALLDNKDLQVIVISQTICSHCAAIKPALNSIVKDYKLKINCLEIDLLEGEDRSSFFDSLYKVEYDDPDFLEDGSIGTPLILVLKNGKTIKYLSGEKTKSQLVKEFKKVGLISE